MLLVSLDFVYRRSQACHLFSPCPDPLRCGFHTHIANHYTTTDPRASASSSCLTSCSAFGRVSEWGGFFLPHVTLASGGVLGCSRPCTGRVQFARDFACWRACGAVPPRASTFERRPGRNELGCRPGTSSCRVQAIRCGLQTFYAVDAARKR